MNSFGAYVASAATLIDPLDLYFAGTIAATVALFAGMAIVLDGVDDVADVVVEAAGGVVVAAFLPPPQAVRKTAVVATSASPAARRKRCDDIRPPPGSALRARGYGIR
jgi:hypothetical protein